jgi:hypothetical protein
MAINSRLLTCKVKIGYALYYVKLTLRVGPYFQVLALPKSFQILTIMIQLYSNYYQERCIIFYSYKSYKQISLKQDNNNYIKQDKSIKLLRADCYKQAVTHIQKSR